MNKKNVYLIIVSFLIIVGIITYIYNSYKKSSSNDATNSYEANRTSQEYNNFSQDNNNLNNTSEENNTTSDSNTDINNEKEKSDEDNKEQNSEEKSKNNNQPQKEEEISSFTTKIYTKDSDRQNNVTIACSTLNNTTVKNGETFSFSNTVGKATSSKGYKKADVFKNGEVIEALGGGLCQVSTTLYNAVLKVPNTKVTERHSHSNKVPYIKSGKDAAVSFGTYDFKFINNTGNTIKIKAENTANNVTIKINKLT